MRFLCIRLYGMSAVCAAGESFQRCPLRAKVWVRLHWAADIASENAMRRLFDEVNTQLSRAADPSAGVTTWSVPNLRKRLLELVDEEQVVLPEPSGRRKRVRGDNRTV